MEYPVNLFSILFRLQNTNRANPLPALMLQRSTGGPQAKLKTSLKAVYAFRQRMLASALVLFGLLLTTSAFADFYIEDKGKSIKGNNTINGVYTASPAGSSLAQCKRLCSEKSGCESFDYNGDKCWLSDKNRSMVTASDWESGQTDWTYYERVKGDPHFDPNVKPEHCTRGGKRTYSSRLTGLPSQRTSEYSNTYICDRMPAVLAMNGKVWRFDSPTRCVGPTFNGRGEVWGYFDADDSTCGSKHGANAVVSGFFMNYDGKDGKFPFSESCAKQAYLDLHKKEAIDGCSTPTTNKTSIWKKDQFQYACLAHDTCYNLPWSKHTDVNGRNICEGVFFQAMESICDERWRSKANNPTQARECTTRKFQWIRATKGQKGTDAFNRGQEKNRSWSKCK